MSLVQVSYRIETSGDNSELRLELFRIVFCLNVMAFSLQVYCFPGNVAIVTCDSIQQLRSYEADNRCSG